MFQRSVRKFLTAGAGLAVAILVAVPSLAEAAGDGSSTILKRVETRLAQAPQPGQSGAQNSRSLDSTLARPRPRPAKCKKYNKQGKCVKYKKFKCAKGQKKAEGYCVTPRPLPVKCKKYNQYGYCVKYKKYKCKRYDRFGNCAKFKNVKCPKGQKQLNGRCYTPRPRPQPIACKKYNKQGQCVKYKKKKGSCSRQDVRKGLCITPLPSPQPLRTTQ